MLDNLLNNSLAKIFHLSYDKAVLHDIRLYLGIVSMKALCLFRQFKCVKKAQRLNNIVVQTALSILQREVQTICNNVSINTDCSLNQLYSAIICHFKCFSFLFFSFLF